MKAIAFDVYGTLINLADIHTQLAAKVIDPIAFFDIWRNKQLEYSFRRGLMGDYKGFSELTRDALFYTNALLKTKLKEEEMKGLLNNFANAPAYSDAEIALTDLQTQTPYSLYAFSNGEKEKVTAILKQAKLLERLDGIVSVDAVETFKPSPNVYQHFCNMANVLAHECLLISSNPFDIIGASSFGMKTVWIKRSENMVFDYWEVSPDYELSSLSELSELLATEFVDC